MEIVWRVLAKLRSPQLTELHVTGTVKSFVQDSPEWPGKKFAETLVLAVGLLFESSNEF